MAAQPALPQSTPSETPTPVPAPEPEPPGPAYPRIVTRGQIQFQFDDGALGGSSRQNVDPVLNGIGVTPIDSQLQIRRARVNTTLMLSQDLEIVNETNFDTRSNSVTVLDMFMRARMGDDFSTRAGLFKIPFGWEGLRSSATLNTIEMADVTRGLSQVRDSGVALTFEDEHWQANLAVVQGQGAVWTDTNAAKDVVGKLSYQFSPAWTVGSSFYLGNYRRDGDSFNIPARRFGLELQYHEAPWRFETEAVWSDGYNFVSQADTRAFGYYATVVRQLDAANDLVLSYDHFDPAAQWRSRYLAFNQANARNRLVLGWNHYFSRRPIHRIMVNYEFHNEEEGPKISNDGLRIRYQYSW